MKINQSTRLKVWTLLTQAIVIIGVGHGALPLMLFEIAAILRPIEGAFLEDKWGAAEFLFGIMEIGGQALVISSIYSTNGSLRKKLQIAGVSLLTLATSVLLIVAHFDPFFVVVYLSCLPFAVCIFLVVFGNYFGVLIRRLL